MSFKSDNAGIVESFFYFFWPPSARVPEVNEA
jgi:hypothetical protein